MSVANLHNAAVNNILLWQLVVRYQPLVDNDILTLEEAVEQAKFEYLTRRELCAVPDDYFCGSNYCDDPACSQEHAEVL